MIEDKYYVPSIEEFYVGFEYEVKENFLDGTVKTHQQFDESKWIKRICNVGDTVYIERALIGTNTKNDICGVRVKYLDKEDIESLGFVSTVPWQFEQGIYRVITAIHKAGDKLPDYRVIISDIRDEHSYFDGLIRNKPELIKALKQVDTHQNFDR